MCQEQRVKRSRSMQRSCWNSAPFPVGIGFPKENSCWCSPCLMQQQRSHGYLQTQEELRQRNVNRRICSYFRSNIQFNLYPHWGFFSARRPQRRGTGRREPQGHNRARVRGGRAPWAVPGASPRRWEGGPGMRGALGGRPWHERCSRSSVGPQEPLGEAAAPQPRSARWRRAGAISRPSEPRPARPGPARSGAAPPRCSCFPGERSAPASPSSASALRPPPSSLPPSPGRSLLRRRQRRFPPAPWRRSPSPRR